MIKILFFFATLLTVQTFAADFLVEASKPARWSCTAVGTDMRNQRMTVIGDFRDTEKQAKDSAIQVCQSSSLSGCSVQSCYDVNSIR